MRMESKWLSGSFILILTYVFVWLIQHRDTHGASENHERFLLGIPSIEPEMIRLNSGADGGEIRWRSDSLSHTSKQVMRIGRWVTAEIDTFKFKRETAGQTVITKYDYTKGESYIKGPYVADSVSHYLDSAYRLVRRIDFELMRMMKSHFEIHELSRSPGP
jgi:hypothetical protein